MTMDFVLFTSNQKKIQQTVYGGVKSNIHTTSIKTNFLMLLVKCIIHK